MEIQPDVLLVIRKYALLNAYKHDGKCELGAVLGKVISERPDLRNLAKKVYPLVKETVDEVNRLSLDEQISLIKENFPDVMIEAPKAKAKEKELPPLIHAGKYAEIVTRFSPNPDCALHLGSARAIILSHDYARRHEGKFILRFEDTDPRLKKASLIFYDLIRQDLVWLGCKWDEEFIQSDRLDMYYKVVGDLIKVNGAYVCTCEPITFRGYIVSSKSCPCRDLAREEQMTRWKRMLGGEYKEGQAIVRMKTDLNHPNPAVRDWPALRIVDTIRNPHPRVGSKYHVWPLYNFAAGVDDHFMNITHIIRGKEHITNTERQMYMYRHLDWDYPVAIHYGRLKIEGAVLSKSKIIQGIKDGVYEDFDDPRLATFLALRRRGFQPDAIRKLIYDVGIKPVDATISWQNLYSYNRQIVDRVASRYFAVLDGIKLQIQGAEEDLKAILPKHPDDRERGNRELEVIRTNGIAEVFVSKSDKELLLSKPVIRLMGLMNISDVKLGDDHLKASFKGSSIHVAKMAEAPMIHWLPTKDIVKIILVMFTGERIEGFAEKSLAEEPLNSIVQLERLGFGRIDSKSDDRIFVYFTSR